MLPIGIENFEEIRTEGYYYVDKTGIMKDLLYKRNKVNLFTRPRRFGKSLNMSMIRSFLEYGADNTLFNGLEISKEKELCDRHMGKYPVISISLKGINAGDYMTARALLCSVIGSEAMRFQFLLTDNNLTEREKKQYEQLINVGGDGEESFVMPDSVLMNSLKTLSSLLEKHYSKKVVILIDEYDVPLAKAEDNGYYDAMVLLIRNMFEQAFKTNESLYFAVLTGCLRISKESIFTGLNNLRCFSITSVRFDEYFGFTNQEVRKMLEYYDLQDKYEVMKEWYDGYRFGNTDVYCPWDVISYCDELTDDSFAEPKDYWSNTSSNNVVRHFIEKVDDGLTRGEIEALVAGETVSKEIYENLTYSKLYDSIDNIWSVLLAAGYLTQQGSQDGKNYKLAIPNVEIRNIFISQIMDVFKTKTGKDGETLNAFCEALQTGNAKEAERLLTVYLSRTIGIRDTFVRKSIKENFYHGIILGILGFKSNWYVKSNKESGDGYSDILIEIEDKNVGIVIEVKYAENGDSVAACYAALQQIETVGYAAKLREDGYRTIYKYGIACHRKNCMVMVEKETQE